MTKLVPYHISHQLNINGKLDLMNGP